MKYRLLDLIENDIKRTGVSFVDVEYRVLPCKLRTRVLTLIIWDKNDEK